MMDLQPWDPRLISLTAFKDWSNYLLVTTTAAVGWVASHIAQAAKPADPCCVAGAVAPPPPPPVPVQLEWALWCLVASAVFGIFTLALVPLVAEQLVKEHLSIYSVRARFRLFFKPWGLYLTQVCRPQHILFGTGVGLYAAGSTHTDSLYVFGQPVNVPGVVLGAAIVAALIFMFARPSREDRDPSDR